VAAARLTLLLTDEGSGDEVADGKAKEEPHNKRLPTVPQLKRQKLEIPYHEQRQWRTEEQSKNFKIAFVDIQKFIRSKRTAFVGGGHGLQARCVRAMESLLMLVVKNKMHFVESSQHASKAHGFAAQWGGRMLHSWTHQYMKT